MSLFPLLLTCCCEQIFLLCDGACPVRGRTQQKAGWWVSETWQSPTFILLSTPAEAAAAAWARCIFTQVRYEDQHLLTVSIGSRLPAFPTQFLPEGATVFTISSPNTSQILLLWKKSLHLSILNIFPSLHFLIRHNFTPVLSLSPLLLFSGWPKIYDNKISDASKSEGWPTDDPRFSHQPLSHFSAPLRWLIWHLPPARQTRQGPRHFLRQPKLISFRAPAEHTGKGNLNNNFRLVWLDTIPGRGDGNAKAAEVRDEKYASRDIKTWLLSHLQILFVLMMQNLHAKINSG